MKHPENRRCLARSPRPTVASRADDCTCGFVESSLRSCAIRAASSGCCAPPTEIFPIPVVVLDRLHRIVVSNESFLELLRRNRQEIAGRPIAELLWPIEGGVEFYNLIDEVLQSGGWFHDCVVKGIASEFPDGPLVFGGQRIFGNASSEPMILLTVQRYK